MQILQSRADEAGNPDRAGSQPRGYFYFAGEMGGASARSLWMLLVAWVLVIPLRLLHAARMLLGGPLQPSASGASKSISFTPLQSPAIDPWSIVLLGGFDRVEPSGSLLRRTYRLQAERILELQVKPDDVWVLTFPRSGTTWTAEMVWLITHDLDFDTARRLNSERRVPWLERHVVDKIPEWCNADGLTDVEKQSSPRCIKSHLHPELLPRQLWTKRPKVLYVARDPKDVIVSNFYHTLNMLGYQKSIEYFAEEFMEDRVEFTPWHSHVLKYWEMRKQPNILFSTYEEMKKDLPAVIRRTAAFLERPLTEEQVARLAEHLSFSSMKENRNANPMNDHLLTRMFLGSQPFIRLGEAGGWRRDMSQALGARVDKWARDHLAASGYPWQ